LILRNEKYSSAAETSIFNVESRIRRISPVLAKFVKGTKNSAIRRRAPNFAALVWFSGRSGNSRAGSGGPRKAAPASEIPARKEPVADLLSMRLHGLAT
jgi:hypothetical protein